MTPNQADIVFLLLGVPFVLVLIGLAWLKYESWRERGE